MDDKEKYKIAFRLSKGASWGLYFIEDYLDDNQVTDPMCMRSICMLLSYNAELLLKSRVVMLKSFLNKDELKNKLKNLSHDLIKIKNELGSDELLKIGIKGITKSDTQYIIKTINNTEIKVEDFIDIRYDYLFGKIRTISRYEYEKIKECTENLLHILNSVERYNKETGDGSKK